MSFKSPIKDTSCSLTDNLPHLGATAILFCCFTRLIGGVHLTNVVFFFLLTSLDRCKQALKQQAETRWMPLPFLSDGCFRVCPEIPESPSLLLLEGCVLPWRQAASAVNKEQPSHLFIYVFILQKCLFSCSLLRVIFRNYFPAFSPDLNVTRGQLKMPVDFDALENIRFLKK